MWFLMAMAMAQPLADLRWMVVNDTVMGGVSSGQMVRSDDGLLTFEGQLSLENNGGFVSVRTARADLGLDDAQGLRVRLRGDGRTWMLNARRSDVPLRAGSYRAPVQTVAGQVVDLVVPFADFEPVSFGRTVQGAPALDSAPWQIDQLGFLLGDKQPGAYTLEVLSIEAIGARRDRGEGGDAVMTTLTQAVGAGVPAFNRGDVSGCRDLYREALERVAASPALTDGEQRVVGAALEASAGQRAEEAAWTLRHAIDTVMAGWR